LQKIHRDNLKKQEGNFDLRASIRNHSNGKKIQDAFAMVDQISKQSVRDGAMVFGNDSQVLCLTPNGAGSTPAPQPKNKNETIQIFRALQKRFAHKIGASIASSG